MIRRILPIVCALACGAAIAAQTPGSQQPTRDTSAAQNAPPPPAGRITGRVVAADNGHALKRARVFVSAAELPGGRGVLTDDSGVYDITELPPGRYMVSVTKTGFVTLSYGQRRPLQAGTPLQLADGQQLKGVDFKVPRGSVIAGRLLDEDGEPMPGASVNVLRYQYQQGDRRLVSAGGAQTDDKGQYRVWGLMPGDYYVSATARAFGFGGRGGPGGGRGGPFGRGGPGDGGDETVAYAPTFFPSVESVDQAKPIALGLSQEVLDVNFALLLVQTARVTGHVLNPDGSSAWTGNVQLVAEGAQMRGQIGSRFGARIGWDGDFSLANIPPGRYMLQARSDDGEHGEYGLQPVSVMSGDVADVMVVLAPGITVSGKVVFPASSQPPDVTQVRITAMPLEQGLSGPTQSRVQKDGTFTIEDIASGPHLIRPQTQVSGFVMESVTIGARDVTDTPIDLRSGQTIANIVVTFTDKISQVTGTITGSDGTPLTEYTVLAFPTDSSLWRAQSRQIMTARPDQTGKYTIRGLPPGEYYIVPVDPGEQGEWFEPAYLDAHRADASRFTLSAGDAKTEDFKIKSSS